ncbi:hypothetical protein [Limibacillus sp. MBR-115]|uniref:hypothetical protein n=1 Tax=Limibacillus sp. MBR-115 TaxID=3156465 RepID=UPI0033927BCB
MSGSSRSDAIQQRLGLRRKPGQDANGGAPTRMPASRKIPSEPRSLADSGLSKALVESLVLKALLLGKQPTVASISKRLLLAYPIVDKVMDDLKAIGLMEILGSTGSGATDQFRFALTTAGRSAAIESYEHNKYAGPAPVSLDAFREQVIEQSIMGEAIPRARIAECFDDLVVPDALITQLGPAVNSGRSLLLYGSAGNGKTSLAERMGKMFQSDILIPYSIEVDGEIIKYFDPSVHKMVDEPEPESKSIMQKLAIERDDFDKRWLRIRRPLVIVGGELTLEMLDLQLNEKSGFYEAPSHMKALNGIMMIDDFGRQLVAPEHLLNRWIVPLEKRIDYLKLHTGKTFEIPFDALVVFSTNLTPKKLMDPAFLRRIPYKVKIEAPVFEHFAQIFRRSAEQADIALEEDTIRKVAAFIEDRGLPLAAYQPKFIIDQVIATCRYEDIEETCDPELIERALSNLHAD